MSTRASLIANPETKPKVLAESLPIEIPLAKVYRNVAFPEG